MEEDISETLAQASSPLHWLGQPRVANALTLLSRLVRAECIRTLDLEEHVEDIEAKTEGDHG